jgi:nitroreductase
VDVEDAIRTRRTTKAFTPEPVGDDVVRELLELAVLAPNHHETEPWRFWVVGGETLKKLSKETGDVKLLRSPRAIVVGVRKHDDPVEAEEDYAAVACAIQNVMLAARGRGLANFWRTPGVMDKKPFRKVLDVPGDVRIVGVVHLGFPSDELPAVPKRPSGKFTTWLA